MKRLALTAPLAALVLTLATAAQEKTDPRQDPSPDLPRPKGLAFIDQGASDARLKGLMAPAGVKVDIVAEAPPNVAALDFGPDGTLYLLVQTVTTPWETFRHTLEFKNGTNRDITLIKDNATGSVLRLTFDREKGIFGRAEAALAGHNLGAILVHDGWLYVGGPLALRRVKLDALPAKEDALETLARGFGGLPTSISGIAFENGWLHITAPPGDHYVQGSDGSRATALGGGAVFRCRPDGSKIHVYATGLGENPGRLAFDDAANAFAVDGGAPGGRLLHVAWGNDFATPRPGSVSPVLKGLGMSGSVFIGDESRFPGPLRGLLFTADAKGRAVRAVAVRPEGASFQAAEGFDLLRWDDGSFSSAAVKGGPDGAVYVADAGHRRIYRLTWAGTKDHPALAPRPVDGAARLAKLDDGELVKVLANEDPSDRRQAQRELVLRGPKVRPALLKVLKESESRPAQLAALGALQSLYDDDVRAALLETLNRGDADLRRLAAEALALNAKAGDREVHEALVAVLNDEDRGVRRAAHLALGKVGAEGADDVLVTALKFDDGKDEYVTDGLLRAIESLGQRGIDRLLALTDSGDDGDLHRAVEAFLALRTHAAAAAVPRLLKNYHLSAAQKEKLLRSLPHYRLDPRPSLAGVVDYLASLPRAVKDKAVTPKQAKELAALAPVKLAGLEVLSAAAAINGEKAEAAVGAILDEPDLTAAAVKALGSGPQGARFVARRLLDGRLPRELRPQVAEALRRHPNDRDAKDLLSRILNEQKQP